MTGPDLDVLFAQLAVRAGAVGEGVARGAVAALRQRASRGEAVRLVQILLDQGALSREAAREILALQGEVVRRLRSIAAGEGESEEDRVVARGLAQRLYGLAEVQRGLEIQVTERDLTVPEILVARGILGARELARLAPAPEGFPAEAAPAGKRIGKFDLLERLGEGGMGVVWRVREEGTGRVLALKTLSVDALAEPDAVQRFLVEARAIAGVRHPNLVELLEVGQIGATPYYTMPVIEGPTLSEHLRELGPLEPREAVSLLLPLVEGLAAVHEAGFVHRDFKPSNVLVERGGRAVLIDFGIARQLGEATRWTRSGQRLGSPAYMSPERLRGERESDGPAGDVWALGVVLCEAIGGAHPFASGSAAELMTRVAFARAGDLPRWAAADRRLHAILAHALDPDPLRRYATAEILVEDLRRYLEGQEPLAPPPTPASRAGGFLVRHAFATGLLVTTAVAAAAVLLLVRGAAGDFESRRVDLSRELARRWDEAEGAGDLERLPGLRRAIARSSPDAPAPALPDLDPGRDPSRGARALGVVAFEEALARWERVREEPAWLTFLPATREGGEDWPGPYRVVLESSGLPAVVARSGERVGLRSDRAYRLSFVGRGAAPYQSTVPPLPSGTRLDVRPVAVAAARVLPAGEGDLVVEFDPASGRMSLARFVAAPDPPPDPTGALEAMASEIASAAGRADAENLAEAVRLGPEALRALEVRKAIYAAYAPAVRSWREALEGGDLPAALAAAKDLEEALAALPDAGALPAHLDRARRIATAMAAGARRLRSALGGLENAELPLASGGSVAVRKVVRVTGSEIELRYPDSTSARRPLSDLDLARFLAGCAPEFAVLDGVRGAGEHPGATGMVPAGGELALFEKGDRVYTARELAAAGLVAYRGEALAEEELAARGLYRRGGGLATEEEVRTLGLYTRGRAAYGLEELRPAGLFGRNDRAYAPEELAGEEWFAASERGIRGAREDARWLAVSLDGKKVFASAGTRGLKRFDLETGREERFLSTALPHDAAVAMHPSGRWLAAIGDRGEVPIMALPSLEHEERCPPPGLRVVAIAFAPGDPLLAITGEDLAVRLWDVVEQRYLPKEFDTGRPRELVGSLCFSPDGRHLAGGSANRRASGAVFVWNFVDPRPEVLETAGGRVPAVTFDPRNRILAAGDTEGTIRLWSVSDFKLLRTLKGSDEVLSLAFDPDGRILAAGTNGDAVVLWDADTGSELLALERMGGRCDSLAFTRDGSLLVAGGGDGQIRVWSFQGLAREAAGGGR